MHGGSDTPPPGWLERVELIELLELIEPIELPQFSFGWFNFWLKEGYCVHTSKKFGGLAACTFGQENLKTNERMRTKSTNLSRHYQNLTVHT